MSTYIIGDIHGCAETLHALLDAIHYDVRHDRVWLVGDLVNNGPGSAEVLRWARAQGAQLCCTLGNHDLHLLAVYSGARAPRRKDTFDDVLDAPDAEALCDWLRSQKLFHREGPHMMVHAGLLPEWTLSQACACAAEVEAALQNAHPARFFHEMYGDEPRRWRDDLDASSRMRLTVNAMTRMRVIDEAGCLELNYKGELAHMPAHLTPWFRFPLQIAHHAQAIFFGHWSALNTHVEGIAHALDSGCTWGRSLTAYRLEDGVILQVPTVRSEAAAHT